MYNLAGGLEDAGLRRAAEGLEGHRAHEAVVDVGRQRVLRVSFGAVNGGECHGHKILELQGVLAPRVLLALLRRRSMMSKDED